jgi:CRP-like cAMP-binding protein
MKKTDLHVHSLRQLSLFKHLADDALLQIAQKAKMRQYFPGDTVVWQGHPSDSLFLIVNGILVVQSRVSKNEWKTLAHLMPGQTFGEVGILENRPRSASVSAVTEVDLLVLRRDDFIALMHQYPTIAIELAKILSRYLTESNKKLAQGEAKGRMILLFDMFGGLGTTSIGVMLAHVLAQRTGARTIYTEHPFPQKLLVDLQIEKKTRLLKHKAGYDILLAYDDTGLPDAVHASLMLEKIAGEYDNILVTLNEPLDEDEDGRLDQDMELMLDNVRQIIFMVPPDQPQVWAQVEETRQMLRRHLRREKAHIYTLVNHAQPEHQHLPPDLRADFFVPYLPDFPALHLAHQDGVKIPEALMDIFATTVDRLERSQSVGLFIPTTVAVDQQADTRPYVERALNFLAERFGGATCKEAQGVWNSEVAGLVGETVYLVYTHTTKQDIDKYLDEVIEFTRALKSELKQEAMALEVNQKMTLV